MKQLIIVVPLNEKYEYCNIVRESEAIEVLQCMKDLSIPAYLEYDDVPRGILIPKCFDWSAFIREYRTYHQDANYYEVV